MPPESPDNPTNLPPPPREPLPFIPSGSRYSDLETHELWQLLDDMEDERGKARRREAFYISTIIYLFLAWFAFYGPHVLWHQPHMINPADALKERNLTYLDLPPDALKQMKPKTPKILSDKDRIEQTPDRKTLKHLQSMEPPAPPTPPSSPEQAALPPEPQPQQPQLRPQQPEQSILEAPKPQQQPKPTFNQPTQSAAETLKQLSENALPTHPGFHGNYGGGGAVHHAGALGDVDVLSDTSGVNPDDLQKYIQRLLYDLRATWIPMLPEETYPPLSKQGDTLISFTILPDGRLAAIALDGSTHDDAINLAAWNSIKSTLASTPRPLPKGMKDPNLSLRIRFMVNEPEE